MEAVQQRIDDGEDPADAYKKALHRLMGTPVSSQALNGVAADLAPDGGGD